MLTLRATCGVVLCCWRAARRRTGSHHKVFALVPKRARDGAGNSSGGSIQRRTSGAMLGGERQTNGVDQCYSLCKERRKNSGIASGKVFTLVTPNV